MRKKSVKYNTPDGGGWCNKSDDLFLAYYRGRRCEICGRDVVSSIDGRLTRSMGHHLLEKSLHRKFRYDPRNIVVLCADHHGHYDRTISPHSDDTAAVAAFYEWLRVKKPEQWEWFKANARDKFSKEWTYKEIYELLGGEISGDLIKDHKPKNHAEKVRLAESGDVELEWDFESGLIGTRKK